MTSVGYGACFAQIAVHNKPRSTYLGQQAVLCRRSWQRINNLLMAVFHLASCPLLFRYVRMGRLRYIRVHEPNQSEARFVIGKLCV
jgi:hypothetical protein